MALEDPRTRLAEATTTPTHESAVNHAIFCLSGIGVGIVWTVLGAAIALAGGNGRRFLEQWYALQGLPLIALGTWLLLVIRSGTLARRVSAAVRNIPSQPSVVLPARIRLILIAAIGSVGTISLVSMGFDAYGALLVFLWISCCSVSFAAAIVTAHAAEMLMLVHALQRAKVRLFRYSPARTPELRNLVNYFTSFSLLMTIGYGFALLGTMSPHWTGNKDYVETVRIFWPVLYVPACSVVLVYPHVVMHRLIKRDKEETLLSCQQEIDGLLNRYGTLTAEEVNRTNTLAQLFDRISATPNYVLDLGNATRTLLPLAFNVASLVARLLTSGDSS